MRSPISRFTVSGNSMFPTLKPGQDVLSINWFVNPKVGDIVVVKSGQGTGYREIVKRVEKLIGGKVWVVGDNKKESTDSRDFGPVSLNQVVGKLIYKT